jgi:hypothetical protein
MISMELIPKVQYLLFSDLKIHTSQVKLALFKRV